MGRDKGKDLGRDAVNAREGVPPLADGCQCSCSVPVELGNRLHSESAEAISMTLFNLCNELF